MTPVAEKPRDPWTNHPDDPNWITMQAGLFVRDVAVSAYDRCVQEIRRRRKEKAKRLSEEADREYAERQARWKAIKIPQPEYHLPLRDEKPAKPRPPFGEYERVTTAELTIDGWRQSYNPDNCPDDFEPPEE